MYELFLFYNNRLFHCDSKMYWQQIHFCVQFYSIYVNKLDFVLISNN